MPDHDTHDHSGVPGVGGTPDAVDVTFDPTGLDNTAATDVQAALEDYDAAITAAGGGGFTPARATSASDVTLSSTTEADVTGLSVSITTGANRAMVVFTGTILIGGSSGVTWYVAVDGTDVGSGACSYLGGVNGYHIVTITLMTGVLSAASHTIKLRYKRDGAGSASMLGLSGTGVANSFVVTETSLAS